MAVKKSVTNYVKEFVLSFRMFLAFNGHFDRLIRLILKQTTAMT